MSNSLNRRGQMRLLAQVMLIGGVVLAAAGSLPAQYLLEPGSPTFAANEPVEMGFVNIANGNLHIEIPIVAAAGRGSVGYSARLVYDSRIWKIVNDGGSSTWQPTNIPNSQGGWRLIQTSTGTVSVNRTTEFCYINCGDHQCALPYYAYSNYRFTDSGGTQRWFPIYIETRIEGCHEPAQNTESGWATDGSGYYAWGYGSPSQGGLNIARAPDGTQVYPSLKDANGNYFTQDASGNWVDTVNRTPLITTVNGSTTYYDIVDSKNSTPRPRITVTNSTVNVNTAFLQPSVTEDDTDSFSAPTSIQLPDGTAYSFTYDSGTTDGNYGLLKTMTLPSGETITFTFATFADAQGNRNRWLNSRVSGAGTWTYTLATCGANCQKVTVHKPSGDETLYTFDLNNGAWNTRLESYQGAVAGTPLSKVENTFKYDLTDPVLGGAGYVVPDTSTTTLQGPSVGLMKKSVFSYDSFSFTYRTNNYTGRRGNLKQRDDYAFGSNAVGAPARKTVLDYWHESNPAYTGLNIINRVSRIETQDGNSQKIAETKTSYDTTALSVVCTDCTVTHYDPAFDRYYTTRGNPTWIDRWVSGETYLRTTLTYDITGQVVQSTDPNEKNTLFSYGDAYYTDNDADPPATYSPGVTTNAYVTQITLPPTGTVSHVSSFGYYYPTGKAAKATDENSQTTYFHFRDTLDRHTRSRFADSGWILDTYGLPGGSPPTTLVDRYTGLTDTTPSSSCTGCRHDQVTLDSLGRLKKSTLVNDPQGTASVDTAYDSSGRVQTVSNPYRGSPGAGDTLAYDGMDRATSVTHPDNSVARTYYGAAVTTGGGRSAQLCATGTYGIGYPILTVDESGNKRQVWVDGLGRLIEADEPDSAGSLALGTCYTYDVLGNLHTVAQGAQSRTFVYDGLSRLTSATLPESGATSFGYDGNGNLTSRTDARNITTTIAYDELNRMTSRTYSDGTPTVRYCYDGFTWNTGTSQCTGTAQAYNLGRLTDVYSSVSRFRYASYDPVGRVLSTVQTTDGTSYTVGYTYNLAGNLTYQTYPSSRAVSMGYNTAARLNSISGYASSFSYAPQGAVQQFTYGSGVVEAWDSTAGCNPTA